MAILNIQRRLSEAGRIRIGEQVPIAGKPGKTRPAALQTFRFTCRSQTVARAVADLFGGEAKPWADAPTPGQWEVYSVCSEIEVAVPPEHMSFSQDFEEWSGARCRLGCDGVTESLSGGECMCDPEDRDCKPVTRLKVMLRSLQGIGLWRLEAKGYNAMEELVGSMELAHLLARSSNLPLLPGRLRIEARQRKVADPKDASATITRNFVVPVLDFDVDLAGMTALTVGGPAVPMLGAGVTPVGELATAAAVSTGLTPIPATSSPVASVAEQLAAVDNAEPKPRRTNSPPQLPSTGRAPRPAAAVDNTPPPAPPAAPVKKAAPAKKASKRAAAAAAKQEPEHEPFPDGTPLPAAQAPPPDPTRPGPEVPRITDPMKRRIFALFNKLGSDRDERLTYYRSLAGRLVTTTNDLTIDEGLKVIECIEAVVDAAPGRTEPTE